MSLAYRGLHSRASPSYWSLSDVFLITLVSGMSLRLTLELNWGLLQPHVIYLFLHVIILESLGPFPTQQLWLFYLTYCVL
jgi:hypothetical protein